MMRKAILFFTFLVLLSMTSFALGIEELRQINSASKALYVKPEKLDQLMIQLRPFEAEPLPDQDSLLLNTYKTIADEYSINNHYKQAYEVFIKYISYKEGMYASDKKLSVQAAVNSVGERQRNDETEQRDLQNKLDELKKDNASLETKRLAFKGNFSLGLIILASLFAIILFSTGVKMINILTKLRQSRDKMKEIHRVAFTGKLETGLKSENQKAFSTIDQYLKEMQSELKSFKDVSVSRELENKLSSFRNDLKS